MGGIEFIVEKAPEEYRKAFKEDIFSSKTHLYLQSKEGWRSFYIVDHKRKLIKGQLHVHIAQNIAKSPFNSPYATFEFYHQLNLMVLYDFIDFVESDLKRQGVKSWRIKIYPQVYNSNNFVRLMNAFINKDYRVSRSELDAVLIIDEATFESKLDTWEKRKLNISKKSGFTFFQRDTSHFNKLYTFIQECRSERGQSLSMTQSELNKTLLAFENSFFLFEVSDKHKTIAAAITIKINDRILYNFYSAHAKVYDKFSPVVLLFEGLYGFCQNNGYNLLDLGTSAIEDGPNFGLLKFKENLGGELNLKLSLEKILN